MNGTFIVVTPFGLCLKIPYKGHELSVAFEQYSKNEIFSNSDMKVYNTEDKDITTKVFNIREHDIREFTAESFIKAIKFIDKERGKQNKENVQQFSLTQISTQKATSLIKKIARYSGRSYGELRKVIESDNIESDLILPSGAKLTWRVQYKKGAKKAVRAYFLYGYHHSGDDVKCYL